MPRVVARELMDGPVERLAELAENLDDIERANRWFSVAEPAHQLIRAIGATSVLDVGCGSADVPNAIMRKLRRAGIPLRMTCLDRSAQMLEIAQARTGSENGIAFVQGDGLQLPFADGEFDVVTCHLALHHFEPVEAEQLLREMRRVAARTPFVSDLVRSPLAYVGVLAYARVLSRNRLTRHDAPLSVRRAYTAREAVGLAYAAGWSSPAVDIQPFFRMTLHAR